jgi:hypothetical protein
MATHARYHTNRLGLALLIRWVIIAAFLGAAGLSYVYLTKQLDSSGKQRRALEQKLQELIVQNNVLETQIGLLTSRTALQRRLDEGFIKLVPISAQAIVHVRPDGLNRRQTAERDAGSQFRTVSRDGFALP